MKKDVISISKDILMIGAAIGAAAFLVFLILTLIFLSRQREIKPLAMGIAASFVIFSGCIILMPAEPVAVHASRYTPDIPQSRDSSSRPQPQTQPPQTTETTPETEPETEQTPAATPQTQPPQTQPPQTQPPQTQPPETQPPETEPPETEATSRKGIIIIDPNKASSASSSS